MRLKRRNVEITEENIEKIRELKANGFKVLDAEQEAKEEEKPDLKSMTVKELKQLAKDKGITLSNSLRKEDIIEFLEDYHDGGPETETTK